MKKILLVACVAVMAIALVGSASAQGKMAVSVGGNVALPMGTFGDAFGVGFGGTADFQYAVMPQLNVMLTSGYIMWSGKDQTIGGHTISGSDFKLSGIPILAGAKYYFMPKGGPVQVYGAAELGFFIASVKTSVTIGGQTYSGTASETDFAFAPVVGIEIPAGAKGALDISANFMSVATTGSSSNSIGARVAYKFEF